MKCTFDRKGITMGCIRNRMVIVHHYDLHKIQKIREDAVQYFSKVVLKDTEYSAYDVGRDMISPILTSIINEEYSFVIMGDCSKLGWDTSDLFEIKRNEWIKKWKKDKDSYLILLVDFGEGYDAMIS